MSSRRERFAEASFQLFGGQRPTQREKPAAIQKPAEPLPRKESEGWMCRMGQGRTYGIINLKSGPAFLDKRVLDGAPSFIKRGDAVIATTEHRPGRRLPTVVAIRAKEDAPAK